jgi:hypothetical protein
MAHETIALFLHLFGAFLLVSGSVSIFLLRYSANSYTKPSEIVILLNTCRYLVPLVAIGFFLTIVFGLALADIENCWKEPWLIGAYVLVGWMLVVGGYAGRKDKQTRLLAVSLVDQETATEPLLVSLKDRLNLSLNVSMLLAIILVIALMVFKPGHESR